MQGRAPQPATNPPVARSLVTPKEKKICLGMARSKSSILLAGNLSDRMLLCTMPMSYDTRVVTVPATQATAPHSFVDNPDLSFFRWNPCLGV